MPKLVQPVVTTEQPQTSETITKQLSLAELISLHEQLRCDPPPADKKSLSDRFLVPPFSVLDARQGYWQTRKRMWIALGIQSEIGRGDTPSTSARVGPGDAPTYSPIGWSVANNGLLGFSEQARNHYREANATPGGSTLPACSLKNGKTQRGDGRGRPLARTFGSGNPGDLAEGFNINSGKTNRLALGGTGANSCWLGTAGPVGDHGINKKAENADASLYGAYGKDDDVSRRNAAAQPQSGTSIFDPVVCELAYRWFCPQLGSVLDPFAGGSVRGIVAAKLGRKYTGMDLSARQLAANEAQAEAIVSNNRPRWVAGDSTTVCEAVPGEYDFVFSCPPYFDLELYSHHEADLSNMTYEQFLVKYREIVTNSCSMLKDDRFACFVVGDLRDERGMYRRFVSDTIQAFVDAGLELYNRAVLVTSVGSLPIRVGRQFNKYRKLGTTHQNVLVFVKGDPGKASATCGSVDMSDLEYPQQGELAIVTNDLTDDDVQVLDGRASEDGDMIVLDCSTEEATVACDVIRFQAWKEGRNAPRIYMLGKSGWSQVESGQMCYTSNDRVYLHREHFPNAQLPAVVNDYEPEVIQ